MVESESSFPDLQLSLSQTAASKTLAISVSVKNASPDTPVTILKWNSPLDEAALGLGLVSITPAEASEPIRMDAVKLTRKMPPGADSLVTLLPGESVSNVIELREPRVPEDVWKAGKAKVMMRGKWMAVWPGLNTKELLQQPQKLQSVGAGAGGSLTGDWKTETVEIGQ
ncbi:hypothetical protein CGLO_16737 [Colletotrichum gloeosporioides Cg-14]|uniref:Uncharacterized protein n=1 Tax=Colletotrichum gloeosporioides (strain Cg-14) TaxID=1237896 RepID=T0JMY7_COLGC|nr:hypothetical protein CGLO_16737 [Colletotrichum gloeosporioides Cg-14]